MDAETERFYEENVEEYAARTDALMVPSVARFIELLEPGSKVLDAGCGSGRDLLRLLEAGLNAFGIDASTRMIDRTHGTLRAAGIAHPEARAVYGSFERTLYAPGVFDGVLAIDSYLHVARARLPDAFAEVGRITRPGGLFVPAFKLGDGDMVEESVRSGTTYRRTFTLVGRDELETLLEPRFDVFDLTIEPSGRSDPEAPAWLTAYARRR